MSKLTHSKEQAAFGKELEIRYGLNIPTAVSCNSAWLHLFIELFSYDPYLPEDEARRTGWHIINSVKDAFYWDTPIDQIARKLDMHIKDIKFILDALQFSIRPLKQERIEDAFPDVSELERLETSTFYD